MRHDNCPNCRVSLFGEPIPAQYRVHLDDCTAQQARWNGRCFCFPYGEATHFRREIGVEVRGEYDGVLYFVCPDCNHAWPRDFTNGPMIRKSLCHAEAHNTVRSNPA